MNKQRKTVYRPHILMIAFIAVALLYSPVALAAPIRVACVGDSITAGARVDANTQSYVAQLTNMLGHDYEVKNFGRGGATLIRAGSPNVWQQLDAVLEYKPEIVVIALGTNDTVSGKRNNWENIGQFDADYQNLIDRLAALPTHPRIFICTPTAMVLETPDLSQQRRSNLEERKPRLQNLCERIRTLAANNVDKNVALIELNALLAGQPQLLTPADGVHPNAAGYRAIAQTVAPHVRRLPKLPNIVLFLVDDMGWQDTSVPFHTQRTAFNDHFRTPNMERLAAAGVKFTQAYACTLCSPTRTSIMTGQNAARHHVTQWTLRPGSDTSQRVEGWTSPAWQIEGLQPGPPTLPLLLRERGYRTIHVGKAHFGAYGTQGEDPRHLGFDVNIAGHCAGGPGSYHGEHNFSAAFRDPDRIWDVPGLEKYHGQHINITEALTLEANAAIEQAVHDDKPFYLYMAHYAVHAPFEDDDRFVQRYLDRDIDKIEAVYASMIESMDDSLGKIMAKLDSLGIAENTLILFASDNGGYSHGPRGTTPRGTGRYTHNWPLTSGKCSAYEGGIRVPMIVSWAKPDAAAPMQQAMLIKAASVCDEPVLIDDFLPTLCHWAGVDDAKLNNDQFDGQDITPLVNGATDFNREHPLIFHYPHFINYSPDTIQYGFGPFSAMRDGQWKVIYFYDRQKWELYDLSNDIGEHHDLASQQPERLAKLATVLINRLKELDAQYPVDTTTGQEVTIRPPGE